MHNILICDDERDFRNALKIYLSGEGYGIFEAENGLEALEILERTLVLVSRASEYLISPNMITLNLDTIFFDRQSRQVRIAYVPVECEASNLRENMSGFIKEMGENIHEKGRIYIDKVRSQMEENNYYIQDLINIIGEIRRAAVRELHTEEEPV